MYNIYDIRKRTHDADRAALEEFLAGGGEIINLKENVSNSGKDEYDEIQKKRLKVNPNSFNPFSKTEALSKKNK